MKYNNETILKDPLFPFFRPNFPKNCVSLWNIGALLNWTFEPDTLNLTFIEKLGDFLCVIKARVKMVFYAMGLQRSTVKEPICFAVTSVLNKQYLNKGRHCIRLLLSLLSPLSTWITFLRLHNGISNSWSSVFFVCGFNTNLWLIKVFGTSCFNPYCFALMYIKIYASLSLPCITYILLKIWYISIFISSITSISLNMTLYDNSWSPRLLCFLNSSKQKVSGNSVTVTESIG